MGNDRMSNRAASPSQKRASEWGQDVVKQELCLSLGPAKGLLPSSLFPTSTPGVAKLSTRRAVDQRGKGLWLMEEMTVVGTSIPDLCVALQGVPEVDSCPARTALGLAWE